MQIYTMALVVFVLAACAAPVHADPIRYLFNGTLTTGDPLTGYFDVVPDANAPLGFRISHGANHSFSFSTPLAPTGDIEWGWHEYHVSTPRYDAIAGAVQFQIFWQLLPEVSRVYDPRYITPGGLNLQFRATPADLLSGTHAVSLCEGDAAASPCPFISNWASFSTDAPLSLGFLEGTATPVPEPSTLLLLGVATVCLKRARRETLRRRHRVASRS